MGVEGNGATENGNNYWGYSWLFKVSLEDEIFVEYWEENYS